MERICNCITNAILENLYLKIKKSIAANPSRKYVSVYEETNIAELSEDIKAQLASAGATFSTYCNGNNGKSYVRVDYIKYF